jgi:branched-subunit amino acid transport protein AzlD
MHRQSTWQNRRTDIRGAKYHTFGRCFSAKGPTLGHRAQLLALLLGGLLLGLFIVLLADPPLELRLPYPTALWLAVAILALNALAVVEYAKKFRSFWNGYSMVLAAFAITYPLSGITHIALGSMRARGFYDYVTLDSTKQCEQTYESLFLIFLAFLALWIGMRSQRPRNLCFRLLPVRTESAAWMGIVFLILGIVGTLAIYAELGGSLAALAQVDRSHAFRPGLARYIFLSRWLPWGVVFMTAAVFSSRAGKSSGVTAIVSVAAVALVLANGFWSGGRALSVFAAIPVLLFLRRISPQRVKFAAWSCGIILSLVIFEQSRQRANDPGQNELLQILDWQAGRFSMIGAGIDIVSTAGFGMGETLTEGIARTLNAPATLLKLPLLLSEPYGITNVMGGRLRGDPRVTGIVPGTICEFYYNFGFVGVCVGYYLIGLMTGFFARRVESSMSMGTMSVSVLGLVSMCTGALNGTATAWIYSFATLGLPCWSYLLVEAILAKRRRQNLPTDRWRNPPNRRFDRMELEYTEAGTRV